MVYGNKQQPFSGETIFLSHPTVTVSMDAIMERLEDHAQVSQSEAVLFQGRTSDPLQCAGTEYSNTDTGTSETDTLVGR